MLEGRQGKLDLASLFKEKYNYDYDGNIMSLLKQDFVKKEDDGLDAMFWFDIEGEKYLFKPLRENDYNAWGELLTMEIAKKEEIPCSDYRIAFLGDMEGVVTKSFLKEDEKLILGSDLLSYFFDNYPYFKEGKDIYLDEKFKELYNIPESFVELDNKNYRKNLYSHFNNIEDIWSILDILLKDKDEIRNIINGLIKILLIDIKTNQGDRHPNNWGLIINKEGKYRLAPLFDNAVSFGLGRLHTEEFISKFNNSVLNIKYFGNEKDVNKMMYEIRPKLTINSDEISCGKNFLEVLSDLLDQSSREDAEYMEEFMKDIDMDEFDTIISKIEKDNGIKINQNLYMFLTFIYERNYTNVNNIFAQHKENNDNYPQQKNAIF